MFPKTKPNQTKPTLEREPYISVRDTVRDTDCALNILFRLLNLKTFLFRQSTESFHRDNAIRTNYVKGKSENDWVGKVIH